MDTNVSQMFLEIFIPVYHKNLGKHVYEDYALCLDVMLFWGKKKRKEKFSGKCFKKCCMNFCVFKSLFDKHKCRVNAFKSSFSTPQVLQIWIGSKKFPQEERENGCLTAFHSHLA